MPVDPVSVPMAVLLAFVAGLAVVWLMLGVIVMGSFRGPDTNLPLAVIVLPLPSIAVFRLVFTGLTGLWQGPVFWLGALATIYGLGTCLAFAAAQGWLSWPLAFAGYLGLTAATWLWRASAIPRPAKASP